MTRLRFSKVDLPQMVGAFEGAERAVNVIIDLLLMRRLKSWSSKSKKEAATFSLTTEIKL